MKEYKPEWNETHEWYVEFVTKQRNEKQMNEMKIAIWNARFEIQES
jgi:hypothetical protein